MSEEKVNRDVLNKLLRQRRLQVNNAKKESFALVDHFAWRKRNEDSEIDCESSYATRYSKKKKKATELSDNTQNLMMDDNELMKHLRKTTEFNMSLKNGSYQRFLEYRQETQSKFV